MKYEIMLKILFELMSKKCVKASYLANKYEDFKNIGCEIYSVSTDTHFVHKAWHDTSKAIKKINYPTDTMT